MTEDKIQTGLRIPENQYNRIKERADRMGVSINQLILVLVAMAFIPNPENKPYINHIDGNRKNNCVSNLEWCTQKENVIHAIHTLNKWSNTDKQRKTASELCIKKRKLSMEDARDIRHLHFDAGYTISELSSIYNLSMTGIKRILYNKSYREEGTKWENMS